MYICAIARKVNRVRVSKYNFSGGIEVKESMNAAQDQTNLSN